MSKKVIIVGGVAAGATTAARLRRMDEKAEIIMIERGEDISFANCGLPYYVGDVITNRDNLLVQTPTGMSRRFDLDIRTRNEVQKIFPAEKMVEVHNLRSGKSYRESYDYLVLCPGAKPIVPDFPGVDKTNVFTVRNIPDSDFIRHYIDVQEVRQAVVVGGGFIGLEMAEMLHHRGIAVTIIEAGPQVMNALDPEMAAIVHNYIRSLGINLILNDRPQTLEGPDSVEQVVLASGRTLAADMVILGIGVRPEVWLAEQAGLTLGSTGGIWVDEYMKTSDPFIYAAGDAVQIKDYQSGQDALVPLAGPANRQGWIIANNIAGREIKYPGSQGTGIVKFKDLTVAMTGKNEKHLQRLGWEYMVCHIHPNSHASYYPGATQITLKLLFTPGDGKVLGAQIVGFEGVDKRIDVLAVAIHAGLTVFDLQELELAYAPPYSSAKDPVNLAGYVASNMVQGDVQVIHWSEVEERVKQGAFLLDVRTPMEVQQLDMVPGATNIPLDVLRENLDKLPRDREIIAYCQVSLRSYIATRILLQHGFDAKNSSGGYKLYRTIHP